MFSLRYGFSLIYTTYYLYTIKDGNKIKLWSFWVVTHSAETAETACKEPIFSVDANIPYYLGVTQIE